MNRFEELLNSVDANPAMVVHLGAGSTKEYELYKDLDAKQIVFVEPDQRQAKLATEKFKGLSNVKVINYAIANGKGPQLFNIFSNPRFSSLLEPAEILDFYPNIKITDSVNVEPITLEQLCLNDNIKGKKDNLLVAELQGLEKEVFSSTPKSTLNKFKWIVISSSEHQLYQPVSNDSQKDLVQLMRDVGFFVLCFKEDASPFTNIMCVRNEAVVKNVRLRERLAKLDRSIVALKKQVSEQQSEASKLELENNKRISDFKASLKTNSNELQIKTDELNTKHEELNARNEELNAITEKLGAKNDELKTRTEEFNAIAEKLGAKNAELNAITEKLGAKNDEFNATTEKLSAKNEELNATTEKLGAKNEEFNAKTEELSLKNEELHAKNEELSTKSEEINAISEKLDVNNLELKSVSNELADAMNQIQFISTERDKLAQDVADNSRELSEMQQTLRINNKLMLKSEADLSDLQNQYRNSLQHQEQQHLLFCELKEKLSQASKLYRKLNLQNLVLDGDASNQKGSQEVDPLGNDDIQS